MKIAADISKRSERVLFFDFENAEHQLLPRYTAKDDYGNSITPAFDITTLNYSNPAIMGNNRRMLDYIKRAFILKQAPIIIIDDITHLFGTGSQADVRHVLSTLRSWVKQFKLSILVIAHANKKKNEQIPTAIEHMAGSYECAYSFDSIFSLNRANYFMNEKYGITHYIKQHKTRMGSIVFNDENVITMNMRFDEQLNCLTMCNLAVGASERRLLRDFGYYSQEEIINAIKYFYKEKFYSIREIAAVVGVSKSQVGRIVKKLELTHNPQEGFSPKPLPPTSEEPLNNFPVNSCSQCVKDMGLDALLYDDDDPIMQGPSVEKMIKEMSSPFFWKKGDSNTNNHHKSNDSSSSKTQSQENCLNNVDQSLSQVSQVSQVPQVSTSAQTTQVTHVPQQAQLDLK